MFPVPPPPPPPPSFVAMPDDDQLNAQLRYAAALASLEAKRNTAAVRDLRVHTGNTPPPDGQAPLARLTGSSRAFRRPGSGTAKRSELPPNP